MSKPKYNAAIYLFNRDLRIQDNELLADAAKNCSAVYPIFILTPEQVVHNKYFNKRAIAFMCESLTELAQDIPLCFFKGDTLEVLQKLVKLHNINAIYNNIDVTPYAIRRSEKIAKLCKHFNIDFVCGHDVFFGRHCTLTKANGTPYLKFTPFYNNAIGKIKKEAPIEGINRMQKLKKIFKRISASQNTDILKPLKSLYKFDPATSIFVPGRAAAERALAKYVRSDINYIATRDIPAKNSTSHLSAYLHYGILGPVEVADALRGHKNYKEIVRQLIWREFYLYIIWMQHTDYKKESHTIRANNRIKWRKASDEYKRWCAGQTGCPIVDAGMRELNETGYMQNRLRMIVAMYLTFYLQIDWRLGEQYFAQNLVDYDYCNNLGGWLWSAGWEVHSNEYYRTFSMASQMKRFDPDAEYVKKWIPELKTIPARDLYDWSASYKKYPAIKYIKPLISDMDSARIAGISMYRKAHGK